MANMLFKVMVEHGIRKHVYHWRLEHRLHSPYEKSIVERTIEYLKDRTEAFDDYYPCMRAGLCNLRGMFTNG